MSNTIAFLIFLALLSYALSSPTARSTNEKEVHRYNKLDQTEIQKPENVNALKKEKDSKKTFSVPKSWAASGMPFSILYMKRSYKPSKQIQASKMNRTKQGRRRSNAKRALLGLRIPYSIIPRVFPHNWRV